jgi:hypothetical protein
MKKPKEQVKKKNKKRSASLQKILSEPSKLKLLKTERTKSFIKNCLFCTHFNNCENPKKSHKRVCGNFENFKVVKEKVTKTKKEKEFSSVNFSSYDPSMDASVFIKQIDSVINVFKETPLPQDIKIDDRDLPLAANFAEFCEPHFLNVVPFAKQMEHALKLLAEYCPKCTDMNYFKDVPVEDQLSTIKERVSILNHGLCPNCGYNKSELFNKGILKVPTELAAVAGQRSGKTALTRMLCAYGYHRFLKLPNGAATYNVLPSEILYSQLIAITWIQSKELLYDVVYNYITDSPWFKNYNELMNFYSNKYGEEIVRIKDTYAVYRHKRLFIAPYGPDKRKLRGRTGYLSAIDELDWLIGSGSKVDDEGKMKINGEEIYTSTQNTFGTLIPEYYKQLKGGNLIIPPPLMLNTSSPSSKKGIITRLYNSSKESTTLYGYRAATWEMNPKITKESLSNRFKINYIKTMRDFGAVPPNSSTPYITHKKFLKPMFNPAIRNIFSINQMAMLMPNDSERTCAKVKFHTPKSNINHCLSIDTGHVNNSFAITTGYYSENEDKPIFDGFCEVIPIDHQTPISFNNVFEEVLCPIIEHMNVKLVVTDRWQNIKLLSDLENMFEVEISTYSPKYKIFEDFKTMIEVAGCSFPGIECKWTEIEKIASEDYPLGFYKKPLAHLVYQILTVKDLGKDVTKGDDTTDDVFRSLIGNYAHLIDENYRDLVTGESTGIKTTKLLGVVGSSGVGGGQMGDVSYSGIGVGTSRK